MGDIISAVGGLIVEFVLVLTLADWWYHKRKEERNGEEDNISEESESAWYELREPLEAVLPGQGQDADREHRCSGRRAEREA